MKNKLNFLIILFTSFIHSQMLSESRIFNTYIDQDVTQINIMELIGERDGVFEVSLIKIDDLKYERIKKIMFQECELEFDLNSDISLNPIMFQLCKNKISSDNKLLVDENKPIITIDRKKFKYIAGTFKFKVSGQFKHSVKTSDFNSKTNGVLKEWYDNKQLYIEYNMKDGIKDGVCKKWYPNGQIMIIYNYAMGKLSGTQLKWYENGNKRGQWNYLDDTLNGVSKEWAEDGTMKSIKTYDNGYLVDNQTF